MKAIAVIMFCLTGLIISKGAMSSEYDSGKDLKTMAVQNRTHAISHEFSGWFGVLPMDAFEKGMTFTGAYTLHFNDVIAWEVGQFTYSYRIKTNLYDDLKDLQQPTAPTPFESVKYFVTSSLVFKPVYMKMAALNSGVAFGEMFFIAGGGYGWMTITGRPIVNFGAGMRVYAGNYVSFRLDIRDYMFLSTNDVKNELWVALGICLGFK